MRTNTQKVLKTEVKKPKPVYRRCTNSACGTAYGSKATYSIFLDIFFDGICTECGTHGAKLVFTVGQ